MLKWAPNRLRLLEGPANNALEPSALPAYCAARLSATLRRTFAEFKAKNATAYAASAPPRLTLLDAEMRFLGNGGFAGAVRIHESAFRPPASGRNDLHQRSHEGTTHTKISSDERLRDFASS